MAIIYKYCIKCGSKNTAKIVYGYPSNELILQAKAGKVKLGGCCIFDEQPEYFCEDCQHEWNRKQVVDYVYNKIKTIKASVGGYFDGYYNVEIDLLNCTSTWSHWEGCNEEKFINKKFEKIDLNNFIEQLKIINLLNWKAKYIEPGVCDGTQWRIEIITTDRIIKKYGDNKFPDEWDMFCSLVRDVTNKKFE